MWLVVLPLVLAFGLVCGDAPSPLHGAYTLPSDSHVMPLHDHPCPVAEDIAPCVCMVQSDTTMDLDCSNVTSEDQLAQIFSGHFAFNHFNKLTIKKNQNLKVLRSGVFGDITFQDIQIRIGELVEVQEGALSGSFTTATTIDMSSNKISSFPFIELEEFSQLQTFYINLNNIQDFPPLKSSSLSFVRFYGNPLTNLPATSVWGLPKLISCDFDNTGISQIEPGTFMGLPHLQEIMVSLNNIQHIPTGAIQLNDKLNGSYVHLYRNRISSIEVRAVTGLKQGWLYLESNFLKELDKAVFRPIFEDGNIVDLYDNPLKCGCDIAWLITNKLYMDQLGGYETCYNGEKLADLDPEFYEQNC